MSYEIYNLDQLGTVYFVADVTVDVDLYYSDDALLTPIKIMNDFKARGWRVIDVYKVINGEFLRNITVRLALSARADNNLRLAGDAVFKYFQPYQVLTFDKRFTGETTNYGTAAETPGGKNPATPPKPETSLFDQIDATLKSGGLSIPLVVGGLIVVSVLKA